MLGTNNNNQITITNGGAVGVGTTTPTTKLDVNGQIRMQGGSPGAGKLMTSDANGVGSWSTAAGAGLVSGSGTINTVPKFTPDGNTLGNSMITDNGFSVGINTSTPGYKLDVVHSGADGIRSKSTSGFATIDVDAKNGDAAMRFANDGSIKWGFHNDGASNNFSLFEYGNGDALYILKGSKNIGIGTSSPASKFHVNRNDGNYLVSLFENSSAANDRSALIGLRSGSPATSNTWYYGVGGTGNGLGLDRNQYYIENVTKGVRLIIDTFGRTILGNQFSPGSTLNIGGNDVNDTASITFGTKGQYFNIRVNEAGQMQFTPNWNTPTGAPPAMTIDDDGVYGVGIGTETPKSQLSVEGSTNSVLNVYNPDANTPFNPADPNLDENMGLSFHSARVVGQGVLSSLIANGNVTGNYEGKLLFWTSSSGSDPVERMRIDNIGVGIGTTAPTEKLHVEGKVKIVDGSQGSQKVLTSNANGVGTWTDTKTLPGTISYMNFVSTGTRNPSNNIEFLSTSRLAVTITSTSQKVMITGTVTLGSLVAGGADGLDIWPAFNTDNLNTPVTTIGGGTYNLRTVQNTRNTYTVTGVATGLAPGTYYFGVAGRCITTPANWNNNEYGYLSVMVVNQ